MIQGTEMTLIPDFIYSMLNDSYIDACTRHPEFPADRFQQLAIIGEEKGEADRDANDAADRSHYVKELSHVAVTCIRAIMKELKQ